jgi:hypothetical protein
VTYSLADLELAIRHVTEGQRRIAGQRRLIVRLEQRGYPTADARVLLRLFTDTVEQMVIHRDAIAAQVVAMQHRP